ncbi:MAG: hypothetical protein MSO56_05010 [Clostridiales bacterium]|nr:hypothetical protein [Clostridiales bacterium]
MIDNEEGQRAVGPAASDVTIPFFGYKVYEKIVKAENNPLCFCKAVVLW